MYTEVEQISFSNCKKSPAAIILPFTAVWELVNCEKALFTTSLFFAFNKGI